jgi:hypothetical protein
MSCFGGASARPPRDTGKSVERGNVGAHAGWWEKQLGLTLCQARAKRRKPGIFSRDTR